MAIVIAVGHWNKNPSMIRINPACWGCLKHQVLPDVAHGGACSIVARAMPRFHQFL